jgi:O-antigen/teichoic acid export membrane protein
MKKQQISNIIIRFFGLALNFVLLYLLTKFMSFESFGQYSFYFSIILLFSIPLQCGFPILIVRNNSTQERSKIYGKLIILFSFIFILTAIILSRVREILNISNIPIWVVILAPLSFGMASFTNALLRAEKMVLLSSFIDSLIRPLLVCVIVVVMINFWEINPQTILIIIIISFGVQNIINLCMLIRTINYRLIVPDISIIKKYYILCCLAGFQMIFGYAEIIIAGLFFSKTDAGILRLSFQLSSVVLIGMMATNLFIQPYITKLKASGNIFEVQSLISNANKYAIFSALVTAILIITWREFIIVTFFSTEYLIAGPYIIILVLINLINVFFGPVVTVLLMLNDENYVLKVFIYATALFLSLIPVAVYIHSLEFLVLTSGITVLFWNYFLYSRLNNKYLIKTSNFLRGKYLG